MKNSKNTNKRTASGISLYVILAILVFSIAFGIIFDVISRKAEHHVYPRKYSEHVIKYAEDFGVPESIVYAVIKTESDFDRNAVSSADTPAIGLMQLTEETYDWVATKLKESPSAFAIYDPETNIRYGVWYLSYLYGRFENWDTAFAAYNAGPGNVSKWLKDPEYSDDGETLKYIPFKETRNYVKKVNDAKAEYESLYYSE